VNDPTGHQDQVRRIFSERADVYTISAAHRDPQVLSWLVDCVQPQSNWRALDIATGTGHTAFALSPHVREVVALDLTPAMLDEARGLAAKRGITNVRFIVGDAHELPFDDGSFELVACRRAAHHFNDLPRALREMRRVLVPNGRLVIDDRSVPEDDWIDAIMHELDTLHDRSHVRQYRPSAWRRLLEAAGFEVESATPYVKHRPIRSLTDRVDPKDVAKIHEILGRLSTEEKAKLNLIETGEERYSDHWYVMIAAKCG
jgi:ubiquinone/menaquinone biosynthesis C-methylase UbiE